MKYKYDPLVKFGLLPDIEEVANNVFVGNGAGGGVDPSDVYWELNSNYTQDYILPKDTSNCLFVGADVTAISELESISPIPAAVFHKNSEASFYYLSSTGNSVFIPVGGTYVATRSKGSAGAETAVLSGDVLGGITAFGYDGSAYADDPTVAIPGFWFQATGTIAAGAIPTKMVIGQPLLASLLEVNLDTLEVSVNENNNDVDFVVNWDSGVAFDIIGSSGDSHFYNNLEIDGDLNHDGSNVGFYGTAPVAQPTLTSTTAYTTSNYSTLRTLDGSSYTLENVLDFLCTLAEDFEDFRTKLLTTGIMT